MFFNILKYNNNNNNNKNKNNSNNNIITITAISTSSWIEGIPKSNKTQTIPSIHPSTHPSTNHPSIHPSIHPPTHPSIPPCSPVDTSGLPVSSGWKGSGRRWASRCSSSRKKTLSSRTHCGTRATWRHRHLLQRQKSASAATERRRRQLRQSGGRSPSRRSLRRWFQPLRVLSLPGSTWKSVDQLESNPRGTVPNCGLKWL